MKANLGLRGRLNVAAAAAVLLLASLPAAGEETTFQVALSGPEVSGDPDGRGQATVTVDPQTNRITVRVEHSNIARPTALHPVHIRQGATGSFGGVVVTFEIETRSRNALTGRAPADAEVVEAILASPGNYYLVVVNDEHPVGALRGPLRR